MVKEKPVRSEARTLLCIRYTPNPICPDTFKSSGGNPNYRLYPPPLRGLSLVLPYLHR